MATASKRVASAKVAPLHPDDMPEAVITTDARHVISLVNSKALALLGFRESELVGWPLEKIFPRLPSGLVSLLAGNAPTVEFQVKAKTRSGRRAVLAFVATPVVRRGKRIGVMYIGRDIRVRSLLESEIKRSRNLFHAVIEHAPYGICVTDMSRRIIVANHSATEITGYTAHDLIGDTVIKFYPDGYKPEELDLGVLRRGRTVMRHLRFRRPDGKEIPVKVSYCLFVAPEGKEEMVIETFSDQSDRLRVDQLKNEFVFVAAHELRNPVTAIRLLLDIIFEDKRVVLDPTLRGYLDKLQEANMRLLQLVDDLLEVSRTEVGRLKIEVAPQDIVQHVRGIMMELRPNALAKSVSIEYAPSTNLPTVLADTLKLKEIITNLVTNAIKYNVNGGSIKIAHVLSDTEIITSVSDTGIGISSEDQRHLFNKFWRSEDMAVRAQAGTGLGLFIVKELCERMGGRIWVESAPGKGSAFRFALPIA